MLISETVDHGSKANLEQALHDVSDTNTAIYSLNFSSGKSAVTHEAALIYNDPTPGPAGGSAGRRLGQLADTDYTTGLVNRRYFVDRLGELLEAAHPEVTGLLLVHLERLSEIQDTLGHATADAILRAVGARLGELSGCFRNPRLDADSPRPKRKSSRGWFRIRRLPRMRNDWVPRSKADY